MDQLFRKEVALARSEGSLGTIVLRPPSFARAAVAAAIVVCTALAAIVVFGGYTRHERVEGVLLPGAGVVEVSPGQNGVVTRLHVSEGQRVTAGMPLIDISGEHESTADGETLQHVLAALTAKRERLRADLADQRLAGELKQQGLHDRIGFLKSEIAHASTQIRLQQNRTDAAADLLHHWEAAGKSGAVSGLQLLQQKDTVLQNQAQTAELQRQKLVLDQDLSQATVELAQAPVDTRNRQNATERDISDVSAHIAESEALRSLTLRAPIDGVVGNVAAYAGQPVAVRDVVLSIVPEHRRVRAQLWLESRSIGFVRTGAPVMIRYDAFPDRRLAAQAGHVVSVSGNTLAAADVSRLVGHTVETPRYQVVAELDGPWPAASGGRLLPGMTLSADILLGHHRFLDWILEPLRRHGAAAMGGVD